MRKVFRVLWFFDMNVKCERKERGGATTLKPTHSLKKIKEKNFFLRASHHNSRCTLNYLSRLGCPKSYPAAGHIAVKQHPLATHLLIKLRLSGRHTPSHSTKQHRDPLSLLLTSAVHFGGKLGGS